MKKNHLFGMFAMAAFAFASCSQDEVVIQSPEVNKAIEFGTYVGRDAQSRGSVITQDGSDFTDAQNNKVTTLSLEEKGFGVFAYYTDESKYVAATDGTDSASPCNFMYNTKVSTADWTYSPVKYWPNDPGDKLTFFAYAPYDDADNTNNGEGFDNILFNQQSIMNGDPIVTFLVNNEVKYQQDLLISNTDNRNKVKNQLPGDGVTVDAKVNFQFAHALSRIGFTVKAIVDEVDAGQTPKVLDENTTIVLREVRLTKDGVNGNTAPSAGAFYMSAKLNLNQYGFNQDVNGKYQQVVWTDHSKEQFFTLNNDDFVDQTGNMEAIYNEQGFVITSTNSSSVNKLNTDDSYLMIIPQNFVGKGFNVYVEYDVITLDANIGYNGANAGYNDLKSKVTNHISKPIEINFESGKAYTLNLQLGMTSVKVTADVETWKDGGNTAVDLPQNTQTTAP